MTTVPLAPGEEWGTRADFSPLVEQRDIDFARASLPDVGGITEMVRIMALCDLHKVGIVPHFTGPIATAGHMHTMMALPGQVLMEFNQHSARCRTCPVPRVPERQGVAERPTGARYHDRRGAADVHRGDDRGRAGPTYLRPDGSPTHW